MKKQRFNRRQFLALSASTLGAVYMTRRAFEQSESREHVTFAEML